MATSFQQTDTAAVAGAIAAHCSGNSNNTDQESNQAQEGGTAGSTERTVTMDTSGADLNAVWMQIISIDNYDGASGNWTVRINITSGNHQVALDEIHICRVNSSHVNQETLGSLTGIGQNLNTTGEQSHTVNQASATTIDPGDYIVVIFACDELQGMAGNSIGYTPDAIITAPGTITPPGVISVTNLGSSQETQDSATNPDINDGTDGTSFSNSNWTPPTDGVILAFIQSRQADTVPETPSISGNGLTWVQIGSTLDCDAGGNGLSLFAADAADAVNGNITITFTNTQVHCVMSIFQAEGVDISGGVPSAFVQNQTNTGTATSGSVTLNAAGDSDNRAIACFWHNANEVSSEGTDFTQIDDMYGAGQARGVISEWRDDAFDTLPDASWSTSAAWAGFAAELLATGGAAGEGAGRQSVLMAMGVGD